MASNACYVRMNTLLGKRIIRDGFIDLKRMELKIDDIYELEVFACSESVINLDKNMGICYFQCHSESSYLNLVHLVRTLLDEESYKISCAEKYCCDSEFSKGYILWRLN